MTAATAPSVSMSGDSAVPGSGSPPGEAPARVARRSRVAVIVLLVAGLLVSGLGRYWAMALQASAYRSGPYAVRAGSGNTAQLGGPTLGSLDSYTLILLLGGLRGPLVMYLWASSENQKNERDLEDFDTKVEMIRLLQPEFDSVFIFQIWNKAYNISAQVPSLPARYGIIQDALTYAKNIDRARPNNVNLLMAINQIYQHKLGSTGGDSAYYRREVREDSKWRPPTASAIGTGALRQRMDPILDANGNLLPDLVTPINPRPADLRVRVRAPASLRQALIDAAATVNISLTDARIAASSDGRNIAVTLTEPEAIRLRDQAGFYPFEVSYSFADWNDGSDLQYLKQYGPYPYGVSPLALGYNYAKRAQVMVSRTGQKPAQYTKPVVDSKPGLELKAWGDEEYERAVEAEARALNLPPQWDRVGQTIDRKELAAAIYGYRLAARLYRDSRAEFSRHLNRLDPLIDPGTDADRADGMQQVYNYDSHLDELAMNEAKARADLALLEGLVASGPQRAQKLAEAAEAYKDAWLSSGYMEIRHYSPDALLTQMFAIADPSQPGGLKPIIRRDVEKLLADRRKVPVVLARMNALLAVNKELDANEREREETAKLRARAYFRRQMIGQLLGGLPDDSALPLRPKPPAAPVTPVTPQIEEGPRPAN